MAEQVTFYVKNELNATNIQATLKRPDGSVELEQTILSGNQEGIPVMGTDFSLFLKPLLEILETKDLKFKSRADVDLAISYSRSESYWKLQVIPNTLPPELPTTVNISLGDDEN